jgi:hypothetical protein
MFQPTNAPGVPSAGLLRLDSSLAGKPLVELRPPNSFVTRRPGPVSGSGLRPGPKAGSSPGAARWNVAPKGFVPVHGSEAARVAPSSRRVRLRAVKPASKRDLRAAETSLSPEEQRQLPANRQDHSAKRPGAYPKKCSEPGSAIGGVVSGRTRRSAAPPRFLIVTALEVRRAGHTAQWHCSVGSKLPSETAPSRSGNRPQGAGSGEGQAGGQQPPPSGHALSVGASAGGSKLPSALAPGRSKQPVTRIDRDEGEARERSAALRP